MSDLNSVTTTEEGVPPFVRPRLMLIPPNEKAQAVIDDKELPSNPDIEKLIIGSIFSSNDPNGSFERTCELIGETCFTLDKCRVVFVAMQNVASRGLSINYATISSELQQKNQFARVGSLIELTNGMPELRDLESFCEIVREAAARRRIFIELEDCQTRVLQNDSLEEITAAASDTFSSIESRLNGTKIDDLQSVCVFSSEDIEFVVSGLIAAGTVNAVTGDAGVGKSTFSTALAGHVACGEPFLGRLCTQRPVLILDRENPAPVMKERLGRLGIQDGGALKIWGAWQRDEVPEPGSRSVLQWVIKTHPKPLIIVDSFIAFLRGDENDASVVRASMQQLRRLADAGATVIVIHHVGKGESSRDYRGSSDFKASLDAGFSITNISGARLERLRIKAFKARFTVDSDLIVHYAAGQFSEDVRPLAVERTVTERLTELLRENPGVTARAFQDLVTKAGLGQNRAFDFLKDGVEAGWVRREKGPRNSMSHYLNEDRSL